MEPINISWLVSETFGTWLALLVAFTMTVTSTINNLIGAENSWVKRLVSWGTGAVVTVAAYFLGLFEAGDPKWFSVTVLAICTSLASNGVWTIDAIREFIEKITSFAKKKD